MICASLRAEDDLDRSGYAFDAGFSLLSPSLRFDDRTGHQHPDDEDAQSAFHGSSCSVAGDRCRKPRAAAIPRSKVLSCGTSAAWCAGRDLPECRSDGENVTVRYCASLTLYCGRGYTPSPWYDPE